ncbi:hypothetical protein AAF712_015208 [Marasmius tenuissimus]|uniref:Uncharacterized protein n=1 Tax=Marasmius tenuissimus TaxID=585030 RepID=A0ABR2Z8W9_9AGAR
MAPDRRPKKSTSNRLYCSVCKALKTRYHVTQHEASVFPSPTPAPPPATVTVVPISDIPTDSELELSSDSDPVLDEDDREFFDNDEVLPAAVRHFDIVTPVVDEEPGIGMCGEDDSGTFGCHEDLPFRSVPIHDRWSQIESLIQAMWAPPDDLEDDDMDSGDELERLPLEDDSAIFEDDLEEDDFWDFGEFDWEQYKGYGRDGRLPASEQVRAHYFRTFSDIENKLSALDLAICRAFSYKLQSHTTDANFRKLPFAFPTNTPHQEDG